MSRVNYRKIWSLYNGPIPKDWEGRSFEIHHIDGNHDNNVIENLRCVSIREHYDIHWFQGDWGACFLLAKTLKMEPKIVSHLNSLASKEKVANGSHNFLDGDWQRNNQLQMVKNGTHHFLNGEWQSNNQLQLVEKGSHHFIGGKIQHANNQKRLQEGIHHLLGHGAPQNTIEHVCPYCKKTGKGPTMKRWHFNNCVYFKERAPYTSTTVPTPQFSSKMEPRGCLAGEDQLAALKILPDGSIKQ